MLPVTVVIPAFNAERFLAAAIESVLRQTVPPRDIVVVDDGSRDATARVARGFGDRVTCIGQENRGVSAARNRGAAAARTEWVAFLDADDEWLPAKLERQSVVAQAGHHASFTALRTIYEGAPAFLDTGVDGVQIDLVSLLFHRETIPPGTSSTLLVRRDILQAIGGYDESLSTAADWDLLLRLRMVTAFHYVAEPLVLYRRHPANMSRSVDVLARDTIRVLDKAFTAPSLPDELRRLRRRCVGWNDLVLAGSYLGVGRWGRAFRFGLRALRADPWLASRVVAVPVRRIGRALTRRPDLDVAAAGRGQR